jgi:hypothetical protein
MHRLLPANQVGRIADAIRDLAAFTPDELAQLGVEAPPPGAFAAALPNPPRRTYSRSTTIDERS